MELGLNFDDTFYEDNKKELKPLPTCYNAKYCSMLWFENAVAKEDEEKLQHLKFSADFHFGQGNYLEAIEKYDKAIGLLPEHNSSMHQDMTESLARAHLMTGNHHQAIHIANKLYHQAVIPSHRTRHLYLLHNIYTAVGESEENKKVLHKLLILHPINVHFWMALTNCYSPETTATTDHCNSPHPDVTDCHISAQLETTSTTGHHNCVQPVTTCRADHHNSLLPDVKDLHNCPQTETTSTADHYNCLWPGVTDHNSPEPDVTLLKYLTCLHRCSSLLTHTLKTTSSFVKKRHKTLFNKVNSAIEQFQIGKSITTTIKEVVSQDLGYNTELPASDDKLVNQQENPESLSAEDFETKWFSWIKNMGPCS
ncbi:uncharacterized protein C8orf76 homolog isoform X2 [Octopus bimaculoides]|uniref:Uncharacterized protein n=2 Tax=Octopus bimaculoides TaxID=37653 RepID=A0A0L8FJN2_OCTBM|nr:uncharacterized protein C8orf76 homolog isoform X2 [Octopus bimaculoides]XP_014789208.1 uncharacterized protein C8orf76 homolog isoform X2 [Octopus bimaculoides]XP_052831127.1 uncharacterized protein C8orf76 homolog isoform X2 [Octopus bimaculoides]|eukprot:XP_014789207.1 PREDICTED: uncharacterized protein C8orf76 homolog isoform X2 [Octopus bimaculoides]